ncbi:Hypothetical predicted protein [Paramuricea clavata]|uniref:Uncharacterized protein n=1 Tax=Paramuricea clavata TaxID=317549 RepID=A0A7D9I2F5_PARCT|nr:Hypothetical predicted protein [Paramuricea clavata]
MERRSFVVGSKRIGRIAQQSIFDGLANIAEPGVDEGNIAAVDATVEDDICITGGSDPEVTVGANEAINAVSEAETLSREDKVKLRLNKNLLTEQDKNLEEFNSKILAGIKKVEDIEDEALEALEFKQEIQRVLVQIELLLEGDKIARQSRQESQNVASPSLSEISTSIKPEQFGSLLVPVILAKIPSELQIIISRKFDKNTWDFNLLLETFKEKLQA